MRSIVVLLAASLIGADGPRAVERPMLTYQVKVLQMDGLGWRTSLQSQLQPVARQGAATVWTASKETASAVAEKAAKLISAPKVTSDPLVRNTVFNDSTRKIVAEVSRQANGPVNHASRVGFVPRIEDASEGWSAEVTGRKIDQGVLATLALEDRQITAVHTVPLKETLESEQGEDRGKTPVEVTIQIPEYARTSVSGEWLIPRDGVLIVSLGVHTVADARGKAVVRERLAVIEADTVEGHPGTLKAGPVTLTLPLFRNVGVGRPAEIPLPLAAPALPSRSLPTGVDASGQPVPLPPLPVDKSTVTSLPGSSEPAPAHRGVRPRRARRAGPLEEERAPRQRGQPGRPFLPAERRSHVPGQG